MKDIKKASDLIKKLVSGIEINKGEEYYSFFSSWERLAGTDIASHSVIKEIERRTLIILVDHPGWAQMVQLEKRRILNACRKEYPELEVKDLRIILEREGRKCDLPQPSAGEIQKKKIVIERKEQNASGERKGFDELLSRLQKSVQEKNDN